MAEAALPRHREDVNCPAIAEDERIERIGPAGHRRPERRARFVGPPERVFGQRRRRLVGAVQHSAAPAVDDKVDVGARPGLRPRLRADQRKVRILSRDKGQVAVVERRMHDHRTGATPARQAQRAPGVKQLPLFGEQRRHFLEDLPLARRLGPRLRLREVGQVHRESAHHRARSIVQLDTRRQPLGGEARLRPHQERGVRRRRAGYRRIARADEIVEGDDAVDLDERFLELRSKVLTLVDDLRRVARLDQVATSTLRGVDKRRIKDDRRQRDRQEREQELHRLRAMAIDELIAIHQPRRDRSAGGHQYGRPPRRGVVRRIEAEQGDSRKQPQRQRAHAPAARP